MPTPALPSLEPSVVVAGDNVQWLRALDDYSAADYTLKYALMPTTGAVINITASTYTDGTSFWVNESSTTTEKWAPGEYLWQASVTDTNSNRTTLFPGRIVIKPDFATAPVANYQSVVKQTLDALYALIQGKATSDQMNYTIRGRSLSRMQPKELLDWLDFYEELYDRETRKEANQQGRSNKGKIVISFNDPSGFPVPAQWWRQGGGY
jgi:hypothetical protein